MPVAVTLQKIETGLSTLHSLKWAVMATSQDQTWNVFTFRLAFSVSSVSLAGVLCHPTYFWDTRNSNGHTPNQCEEKRTKVMILYTRGQKLRG